MVNRLFAGNGYHNGYTDILVVMYQLILIHRKYFQRFYIRFRRSWMEVYLILRNMWLAILCFPYGNTLFATGNTLLCVWGFEPVDNIHHCPCSTEVAFLTLKVLFLTCISARQVLRVYFMYSSRIYTEVIHFTVKYTIIIIISYR